jgi:type IV secretion system protein TrbL
MLSALIACKPGPAGLVCQAGMGLAASGTGTGPTGGAGAVATGSAPPSGSGGLLALIAEPMATAAEGLIKTLGAFWMNVGTPQLTGQGTPVATITGDTRWIVNLVAIGCILVAAARMAILRRGEPAKVVLTGLARLVFVTAAATIIVQAAGYLGDQWSAGLLNSAHLGNHGWSTAINVTALAGAFGGGEGVLLIVALLLILSSLIQLMLMVMRVGLVIVLTGTLPLAAAASMCDWGESWWRRHVGWLVAWLLYKPAAALLFASAFALTGGNSLTEVLAGWMLLVLSVLILPALLRLIVPLTSALGAASAGSLMLAAAGAAASGAAAGGLPGIGAAIASRFRPSGSGTTGGGQEPATNEPDDGGMPSGSGTAAPAARALLQPAADQSVTGSSSGAGQAGIPAGAAATGVLAQAGGAMGSGASGSPEEVSGERGGLATASGSSGAGDAAAPGGSMATTSGPTGAEAGAASSGRSPEGDMPPALATEDATAGVDGRNRPSGAADDSSDGPSANGGTGNG